jgi:hypothetical protein
MIRTEEPIGVTAWTSTGSDKAGPVIVEPG